MISNNTNIINKNGVTLLKYPIFDHIDFITHCCSTRHGGFSKDYYSSMNLGLSTDDDFDVIKQNWLAFCNSLGVDVKRTVCANQQHDDNILIVTEKDIGKGVIVERDYDSIDGLITNIENIPLCIFSADCIPVLFVDTKNKVIGAAHCGWRGTYLDLSAKMIDKMEEEFGCEPENIKCAIGPGIKSCCYEVSKELFEQFNSKYGGENCFINQNKYYLDLQQINKQILLNKGIEEVFVSDLCTCCNKYDLFSHRGSNGKRGLMVNLIMIK